MKKYTKIMYDLLCFISYEFRGNKTAVLLSHKHLTNEKDVNVAFINFICHK